MCQTTRRALAIGLLAGLLGLALDWSGALAGLEYLTWDVRVAWFARPGPHTEQVRIIVIDQASLAWARDENELPWPWPRQVYAPILSFLKRGGAKAVGFDMLFTEPSQWGTDDDKALAAAIAAGPPFVGTVLLGDSSGSVAAWPAAVPPPPFPLSRATVASTRPGAARPATSATFPIAALAPSMTLFGTITAQPDTDSTYRRLPLWRVFDGQVVPALGLALYWAGTQGPVALDEGGLVLPSGPAPCNNAGESILRFRGPSGTHPTYSARDILRSELLLQAGKRPPLAPETFRDCFVLLGPTAPGLLDLKSSPLSPKYPGVEFHATLLDNLLAADLMAAAPAGLTALWLLCLAGGGALAAGQARRPWQNGLALASVLLLPPALGGAAYPLGIWLPVAAPTIAGTVSVLAVSGWRYAREHREKRFIKNAFQHYLSQHVIHQLLADPARLTLGGERRALTIFFTDLQGFTGISERLEPEALTALLNAYLSDMTDILLDEEATLDKYEGDAIIAFWNAPLAQPDHPTRGVRAALRCQARLAARRAEWEAQAGAPMRMRIGLHTGEVVVGNMGSTQRFDYTILGDAANLASRLEGANKRFGTYLMVSADTWQAVAARFLGREIGLLRVVGRATPIRVFEPLGPAGTPPPPFLSDYEAGLALCREGAWQEALNHFRRCEEDPLAATYAHRCAALLQEGEPHWDGVWNLTEK